MFKCNRKIRLATINEDCSHHLSITVNATLEDNLHQPLEAEPTNIEKRVAASLVKRILHQQSDNTIISLPRRGKVNNNNHDTLSIALL